MKEYPETHQQGTLVLDRFLAMSLKDCDFGVQVAKDGRVWICVDGQSVMRFQPHRGWKTLKERLKNE